MDKVKTFDEHRLSKKKKKHKKSDGSVEAVHDTAQKAYSDWSTDAYRSQSARRESDVTPL